MVPSASTVHFMTEDSNWAPPPPPNTPPPISGGGFAGVPSFSAGAPTPVNNGARFWAAILDGVLMVVTLFIGWIIWSVVLYSQSTSPAKKILGLQIVDAKTGVPASMQQMLLREVLGKMILGPVSRGITGLISAIMILVMPNRQGIHDYIAKTVVIRKP
jgi:uncharacterized RDD family membrane protein YckC